MDTVQVYFKVNGFTCTLTLYKTVAEKFNITPNSYVSKEYADGLALQNMMKFSKV